MALDRSSSGEVDMPAKRKLQPGSTTSGGATAAGAARLADAGGGVAPAPAPLPLAAPGSHHHPSQYQHHHHHHHHHHHLQRASCGLGCSPAMSSPAIAGAWGMSTASPAPGISSGNIADADDCSSCHATAESARSGKTLRVCAEAAAAAGASAGAGAGAPAGAGPPAELGSLPASQPVSCQGGGGAAGGPLGPCALPPSSLPPEMYRSYHLGCCSRMSSTSSLFELEAGAAAAAAAAAAGCRACGSGACEGSCQADTAAAAAAAAATAAAATASSPCSSAAAGPAAGGLHAEITAAGLAAAAASRPQQGSWPPPSPCCRAGPALDYPMCGEDEAVEGSEEWQQGAGAMALWHEIPDDILKRVLEQLQPSTLRVLRLVCRGWEAAASRLLRHLRPETILGKQLSRRFPALHSLDLSNAMMGLDCPTPRMLRLQSLLRDEHLVELAGLTRLEQLSLRGCTRISGMGLAQLGRLSGLSMLNLSHCSSLMDECLAALAAAVPQLATLNLQGCSRLGDDGIAHLVAMPQLRHVLLPAGISDACMATLTEMPVLERVALRGCTRVTTAGIYLLLQRRGLKRVVISKCPHVTLETLCCGSSGELEGAKLITAEAASLAHAAAAAAAAGAPAGAGLVGQDMQLLVGDA